MNKIIIFLFLALLSAPASATEVKEVRTGGVKAWLVQDNSLPIVAIKIAFKGAGYAHDAIGKQGIANFVAGTLNEGSGEYDSNTYQKLLDENAIQLVFDSDKDNFYITLKTVSSNLDLAVNLLKAAMTEPHFGTEDVNRVRAQILTMIKKSEEDANYLADKKFAEIIFKNHPYSKIKEGNIISVNNISSEDLILFVADKFSKNNIVFGIVGDIDENSTRQVLSKLTDKLPEKAKIFNLPDIQNYISGVTEKVKINNPQTTILFGQKGVKRQDADFYTAYVLNHIIGGDGFQSKLTKDIREKRGLAYFIGTELSNNNHANLLIGSVGTKSGQEQQVIDLIKKNFASLIKKPITQNELDEAKSYITGSFALNLDKNEKLAAYMVMMQLEDLGDNYLQQRNNYINSVTLDQVNNLAKNLISPENLVFTVVGQ